MEVCSVIEARTGKHMNPRFVLEWLRKKGLQDVRPISREARRNDFEGIVFVDEKKYEELLSPFTEGQHPIDKKRIDVLSNIWDHLETDNGIFI